MKKGFTIIEVIIAITILTIGILGAFAFISHYTEYTSISNQRFIASYLAQEGIEIVKNIRDGNYLEGKAANNWSDGFATSNWDGEADYTSSDSLSVYSGDFLKIDNNGFYSYVSGTPTLFVRKIHIATSTATSTYISATVDWQERGRSHQVSSDEEINNWAWQ